MAAPVSRRLSEELTALREGVLGRGVSLGEMMDHLQGRGFMLFLILLVAPFCQPVPLPGLSMLFGIVVAFIGLRITLRQKPWLPERLRRVVISGRTMGKLIGAAVWLIKWIEKWSRPRTVEHFEGRWTHSLYGIVVFL
ncbi:MAG TPA: exopolysaccharide biosynthesis protein [Chthoniobacterales bacterium]